MVFFAYLSLNSTRPDWIWQNYYFVNEYLSLFELEGNTPRCASWSAHHGAHHGAHHSVMMF